MPTSFYQLAELCRELETTAKRKEKTQIISSFLKTLEEDEISEATLLLIGTIFPASDGRVLDVGWNIMKTVLETGGQTTLNKEKLSIKGVYMTFIRISETTGRGSRKKKQALLESLMNQATSLEQEYLTRMVFREMRIGVNEGNMIDGVAKAAQVKPSLIRRVNMLTGNIGLTALIALTKGERGLIKQRLKLFTPIKPMLAATSYDLEEILNEHEGISAFEYKLDGARLQIHKQGDTVKLYSRRLSDVTDSLPDIVEMIQAEINAREVVFDAEAVAIGSEGKPLPFQDLMRRFRRVRNLEDTIKHIPLRLHIFDILYYNGRMLIDETYEARWNQLSKTAPKKIQVKRIVSSQLELIEKFLKESLEAGNEGLMAKSLNSRYTPGIRGKRWFKYKSTETLDLVIVAADWGYGRRTGWLSNYHLAASSNEKYLVIGKTFKGLTDAEFQWMTKRLQEQKIRETQRTVYVKPSIVLEVEFNEVQKSSQYKSGYALRFARIKKIREDKTTMQVDTMDKVVELYEAQFRYKEKFV